MRIRRLTCIILALALVLALAACGGETPQPTPAPTPSPSGSLEPEPEAQAFALPCYPESGFHPITGANRTNLQLAPLMYEGLFELNGAFEPATVLCQSWQAAEDGLSWSFTLKSATFSDGSAVTAEDAAYSINLARTSALYAARLTGVTGAAANADGGLTVTLSAPNGALPALLDIPIVRENGEGPPLGTGPYVLREGADGLSLEGRSGWWQGKALPVDSIPLRRVQEADDLIYAFDTRDISLVSTDFTGTNALGYSGSYETLDYPTSVMLYVGFNTKSGACRDAAVRRALSRDFDRAACATVLLSRHAQAAALPFPPGTRYYDAELADTLAYDPQGAAALLEEAGWTLQDGKMVRGREALALKLVVNQDNTYKLGVAEALATSLSNLGITVSLEKLSWDEYVAALEKGSFDIYLGEARLTADFDLRPLLRDGGALNYGGFADRDTAALQEAYQTAAGNARVRAAQALNRDFLEKAPFAVLCFKNWSVLTQWGQVEGLASTQQNVFYGFADWKIN